MKVDYADLGLAQQVISKQGDEHLTAVVSFLDQWAVINAGEMGGLFSLLVPLNNAVCFAGKEVLEQLAKAHSGTGRSLEATIEAYAEADHQIWKQLARMQKTLGLTPAPYDDPRSHIPSLGLAANRAGSMYGGGDPFLFVQSFQDGYSSAEYVETQSGRLSERVNSAFSGNALVREEQDPQSYLVTPEEPTSEMENLRWSAGLLLGGLDWVFEKICGWSLLNDFLFKEIIGDWRYVKRASIAWKQIDDALVAVGQNDSGILPGVAEWTGKGSEACAAFVTALSAATTGLSYAAGTIGDVVLKVVTAAKLAAWGLGKILKVISYKLARIAAEAAVPAVGWAAAVIEAGALISTIFDSVKMAYAIINTIYDAISELVQAKLKIVEVSYTVSNIAEAAAKGAAVRL